MMVEMELVGVQLELPSNSPIVLLREQVGARRILPIVIGHAEATAIAFALENVETPRPLTHDLLREVIEALGAQVASVVVSELRGGTFFADLELMSANGPLQISCRPSDGVALALRSGSPIYASEAVLDEAGQDADLDMDADGDAGADEVVEQFREFIEHVEPDDFAT